MTHGRGLLEAGVSRPACEADTRRRANAKRLYALGLAVAAGCLYPTFRDADLGRAWAEVARLGPVVLLAFVPYGVSLALDGHAWSRLLAAMGRRAEAWKLFCLRAGAESLALSLPAGALLAETMKPVLLRSRCGVPLSEGVSVIAVRKVLILLGHGLYLAVGLALGASFLSRSSARAPGGGVLPWAVAGVAVVLACVALGSGWVMAGGLAGRLGRWLLRLPHAAVRGWVERRRVDLDRADGALGRVLVPGRLVAPALLYLGMWLAESVEAYLLLRLLGFDVTFGDAVALEAVMSVLRALVFFIPAGLGVQDAGYAAFLAGPGGPDALHAVAAFVLLKRARELCWMGVGYVLLVLQARARGQRLEASPLGGEVPGSGLTA
ncbi:lysylphosphatidylglycerol synthase transmembrane domain-containing protein [Myxococcus sp. RHSTA-1-4]|uniref:lysylphosphatidylglycerol synthase transmembrane domain-containing protein n=1 Tax=Myxococcus sp. RHSTA-1-4 TaxID=2874601 RepID=UPI001CBB8990|nr:lysylphosphatidylglycerol synthase transmembrane domain-containing protein [Myxococcus sp. RHSTA-1-4]MBZ4416200.1 flippase-like domain-containing protein [Myxococcus sp. RHSTA-1-4]